jgi:arylsulfatase A-like enzyme
VRLLRFALAVYGAGPARGLVSLCLGAGLLACGGQDAAGARDENVLLVTLDTTRADHLSCYGYGVHTTPVIDELARDGVRFERALSSAGLTPMAHASILTGLHSHRHGLRIFHGDGAGFRLADSATTLAERLRDNGWQTAARVSAYPASQVFGLDQGFESFETGIDYENLDLAEKPDQDSLLLDGRSNNLQRRSDATVDDALEWLAGAAPVDAPWFLWVHLFDAHDYTLVPPESEVQRFGISYDQDVQPRDAFWNQKIYDPEIAFMDQQLGRLFDSLRESGEWERTLVIVTADHGEGLEDGWRRHKWAKHRLLYDWCLRVPLIIRLPGQVGGLVLDQQVRTLDIPATVLERLGLEGLGGEGVSLLPDMHGTPCAPRMAFAEALNLLDEHAPEKGLPPTTEDNLFCVSDGRWKLIWHAEKPENHELFDLETDPQELHNLASSRTDQLDRLADLLRDAGVFRIVKPEPGDLGSGPEAGALHALGYGGAKDD